MEMENMSGREDGLNQLRASAGDHLGFRKESRGNNVLGRENATCKDTEASAW